MILSIEFISNCELSKHGSQLLYYSTIHHFKRGVYNINSLKINLLIKYTSLLLRYANAIIQLFITTNSNYPMGLITSIKAIASYIYSRLLIHKHDIFQKMKDLLMVNNGLLMVINS